MKTDRNKSKDVLRGTEPTVRQRLRGKFIKVTEKKSTTSGITELEVLIMLGLLLSQSMRIEFDNQKDIKD